MLFGFLQLATAHTFGWIFTQNTPKDVVPAEDMLSGSPD